MISSRAREKSSPPSSWSPSQGIWAVSRPRRVISKACKITNDYGTLLIFDEVMTGFQARPWWGPGTFRRHARPDVPR